MERMVRRPGASGGDRRIGAATVAVDVARAATVAVEVAVDAAFDVNPR
jgi:hypothetical protein